MNWSYSTSLFFHDCFLCLIILIEIFVRGFLKSLLFCFHYYNLNRKDDCSCFYFIHSHYNLNRKDHFYFYFAHSHYKFNRKDNFSCFYFAYSHYITSTGNTIFLVSILLTLIITWWLACGRGFILHQSGFEK